MNMDIRCLEHGSNGQRRNQFAVVDLFAGPGGLAEGFAEFHTKGNLRPFPIVLSVENDTVAFKTLLLRHFLRQFQHEIPEEYYGFLNGELEEPDWPARFPDQWQEAAKTVLCLQLGAREAESTINSRVKDIRKKYGGNTVLIGGPPCQIYSLVGRARNAGNSGYDVENDSRTTLYQEYLRILGNLEPAAFVLENVKGILSFSYNGNSVLLKIMEATRNAGYVLIPLSPLQPGLKGLDFAPKDFVVRTEVHGVPQARHRVILVGIRKDLADRLKSSICEEGLLRPMQEVATVRHVLSEMPFLRSGLSRTRDTQEEWLKVIHCAFKKVVRTPSFRNNSNFQEKAKTVCCRLKTISSLSRKSSQTAEIGDSCPSDLRDWIRGSHTLSLTLNETRSHMVADLERYFFAAVYAEVYGKSAKARDFPPELAPNHQNWQSGKFADRYRVQLWDRPSKTVTCHIAKDGHYYIHPDPAQCRSLTVREVARLQTFPDNYFFRGNRTQQYTQVGNAVPPYLAKQIAEALYSVLDDTLRQPQGYFIIDNNTGDHRRITLSSRALLTLFEFLQQVPDSRSRRGRRYPLAQILTLAVMAMLCGARSLYAISQWGHDHSLEMAHALGFDREQTPCYGTLHRVFKSLDHASFKSMLMAWIQTQGWDQNEPWAMNGKQLRGWRGAEMLGGHLVALLGHYSGAILDQQAVSPSGKLATWQQLQEKLPLVGRVVTDVPQYTQRQDNQALEEKSCGR